MRNKQNKIIKTFLTFLLVLFCLNVNSFASPSRNITVFAEPNMALPLTKIARLFSQKSNVIVSLNFDPFTDLITDIDSGEPADVFISAHSGMIATLRQKGLVDVYNFGYVARDEMVLITSASNQNIPSALRGKKSTLEQALKILDKNKLTLIIDNISNSSGKSGSEFLAPFRFVNLKIFKKLGEDKTPIVNLVKTGRESYGLLLVSQTVNQKDILVLADNKDANIFYEALVIAGDNMEVAREFLKFMKSDLAKTILQESGFKTE